MYYITDQVGNNLTNNPMDIIGTKENFKRLDLFDGDVSMPFIDKALDDTIIGFQRDNGLKVDRKMNPGGPTEQMVARRLKDTPPIPRRKPERQADTPPPIPKPKDCAPQYAAYQNAVGAYSDVEVEMVQKQNYVDALKMRLDQIERELIDLEKFTISPYEAAGVGIGSVVGGISGLRTGHLIRGVVSGASSGYGVGSGIEEYLEGDKKANLMTEKLDINEEIKILEKQIESLNVKLQPLKQKMKEAHNAFQACQRMDGSIMAF